MKIRCLIVDDEKPARDLLASYVERLTNLELAGQCKNGLEAFEVLQQQPVDIVFLDIEMQNMNGLDLVKLIHDRSRIVLTTAFREYAVEGFDYGVLDYLVKPVSFGRFLKAIGRYNPSFNQAAPEAPSAKETFDNAYMFFKVNKSMIKVYLKDILFIESIKDYVKIVTCDTSFITYQRIGYLEEKLPEEEFIRIHKSYIISKNKMQAFKQDVVTIEQYNLPVGRLYKRKLVELLS